jgi:threonine/homoserine/homoserine lactone efflux protein
MTTDSLFTLFLAALVLMIRPGPYMMALISLCSEGKWRSALSFWSGYLIVAAALYYTLLTTLSLLPDSFGIVFIFLKSAAALLFIIMGFTGLKETIEQYKTDTKTLVQKADQSTVVRSALAGAFLCVSNPYEIIWVVVVIPSIVGGIAYSFFDITVIYLTCVAAGVLVNGSYCLPLILFSKKISSDFLQKIKIGSSVLLIAIGLYIFATILIRSDLVQSGLISPI